MELSLRFAALMKTEAKTALDGVDTLIPVYMASYFGNLISIEYFDRVGDGQSEVTGRISKAKCTELAESLTSACSLMDLTSPASSLLVFFSMFVVEPCGPCCDDTVLDVEGVLIGQGAVNIATVFDCVRKAQGERLTQPKQSQNKQHLNKSVLVWFVRF